MVQSPFPILCADELSTGLDSSSTFSICNAIMHFTQVQSRVRILSLLQPSPETVALFDEIILIAEGKILYSGPVGEIEDYFARLGYVAPDTMDVADFCQVISSPDGAKLYKQPEGSPQETPYKVDELAAAFQRSDQYQKVLNIQKGPWANTWTSDTMDSVNSTPMTTMLHQRFRNSGIRNLWLNLVRNLVIWSRDKRFLIANAIKNLIMGVSVGGVFYQTTNSVSIFGVLFQLNLFIMLGAMTSIPAQVEDRIIFYRHYDANFYGAFAYAFGKAISLLPQSLCDVLIFATICYFMVGLTAAASNYFIFIAILFVFSFVMNQQLAVFTAFTNKSGVQAGSAVILLFFLVFCGFLVTPVTIPNYYQWIYWWNPLAWGYRALLVNEFNSPDYDMVDPSTGERLGETILANGGMIYKGEVFGQEWVAYSFAYMVPYAVLCTILQSALLRYVRVEPKAAPSPPGEDSDKSEAGEEAMNAVDIPFKPVTLTFTDICYDVTASKGKDKLRLLNNANGVFEAGRMLALMGSSGAGKTTLMDVIALRKTTGTIQGDVRLNGFEQEEISFRRCSGYVEQFDVQSPQLTVRETVLFSARLRLNSEDPNLESDGVKQQYTDQVLEMLELTSLAGAPVGTDGEGGLSFEQRKRLSIAVELAASPSIIFLDEPTSGLDSRAALLVVKILRKIANQGRTVVATIHQPSSSVFEMFDDLLLLKKGGRTVFFGELGVESCNLVKYFESLGATPIQIGENPADWMLTIITSDNKNGIDYVDAFTESSNYQSMQDKILNIIDVEGKDTEKKVEFTTEYAADKGTRRGLINKRLQTIYWRSPAYNLSRMVISVVIAFVLGSIYVTNRLVKQESVSEQEMTGILSLIFISFIIIGVMSINAVLPIMLGIRDSFYKQRAAGMYGFSSLGWALAAAEKYFIIVSSALFCVVFLPCVGIGLDVLRGISFWGFFTFNIAIYSYFGQAFVACVPTVPTAQILAAVFIGLNNFFSGLIVRPQYLSSFFEIPYWITPGHYVYEGLVIAAFHDDQREVVADPGSDFYVYLMCDDLNAQCVGTIDDFINVFFGGKFSRSHLWYDIVALTLFLIAARVLTFFALRHFNYTGQ
jgi:ABC-type multidrug transport system ATPase subunit